MSWRNDPVTEKQLKMITDMIEFSEFPLPKFTGKTKGEASDYINKWLSKSHESLLDIYDTTQGIP